MTLTAYLDTLKGKSVAVIGIGISNVPLIRLLRAADITVTACDKKNRAMLGDIAAELEALGCKLRLGEDYLSGLCEDVIFRTPGLHPRYLEEAKKRGSIITSEMEVFFEVCPCPIIAITGSDGKTTTTTMIAGLLRASGKTVHLGGNIGHPLLADTENIREDHFAVVELSSFQLMTMKKSPCRAVLTNLSPNHLDVHTDMDEYVNAKKAIFAYQNKCDLLVTNLDNEIAKRVSCEAVGKLEYFTRKDHDRIENGCYWKGDAIWYRAGDADRCVLKHEDILLPGVHNIENYMAAICAVQGLVDDETIRTFARTFGGVEHRIELVRERRGVRWYNDSIASSPSRTIAGLNSFAQRIVLIAGGKDKGISYTEIGPVINERVKLLILCGATAGVIREATLCADNYDGLEILEVDDYRAAVALADERTGDGDIVILSPASTSFDRFKNFEERGRVFKDLVRQLPE